MKWLPAVAGGKPRYGAAPSFTLRTAPSEGWWRRGDSNPRPNANYAGVYVCSFCLNLARELPRNRPPSHQPSVGSRSSTRRRGIRPSLLSSPRIRLAGVGGGTRCVTYAASANSSLALVFFLSGIYEVFQDPRHAAVASTHPSKPVAPERSVMSRMVFQS